MSSIRANENINKSKNNTNLVTNPELHLINKSLSIKQCIIKYGL